MVQHDPQQFIKTIQWVDPEAFTGTDDIADSDTPIDTIGFRYALITLSVGAIAAIWTIQVEASATSGGTYANITGAVFALIATSDDTRFIGIIDLQGSTINKNRFLQLNGTSNAAAAVLGINLQLFAPADAARYVLIGAAAADEPTFSV